MVRFSKAGASQTKEGNEVVVRFHRGTKRIGALSLEVRARKPSNLQTSRIAGYHLQSWELAYVQIRFSRSQIERAVNATLSTLRKAIKEQPWRATDPDSRAIYF